MCYLQGTKHYMFTYHHCDSLEVMGYRDLDFMACVQRRIQDLKVTEAYERTAQLVYRQAFDLKGSKQII